eukprot:2938464-Amphidinium_carterae.1
MVIISVATVVKTCLCDPTSLQTKTIWYTTHSLCKPLAMKHYTVTTACLIMQEGDFPVPPAMPLLKEDPHLA